MICAVCCLELSGKIVSSKNNFCPFVGHWIHYTCQGLNSGSIVSCCSVCKRLGSGYVTSAAGGNHMETVLDQFAPVVYSFGKDKEDPGNETTSDSAGDFGPETPRFNGVDNYQGRFATSGNFVDGFSSLSQDLGRNTSEGSLINLKRKFTSSPAGIRRSQKLRKVPGTSPGRKINNETKPVKAECFPNGGSRTKKPDTSSVAFCPADPELHPEETNLQPDKEEGVVTNCTAGCILSPAKMETDCVHGIPDDLLNDAQVLTGTQHEGCSVSCEHFSDDQQRAFRNLTSLLTKNCYGIFSTQDIDKISVDTVFMKGLPSVISDQFVPVTTPSDGNCMYHAISFCLFKSFGADFLLRRLQHAEFQTNQRRYQEIYESMNMIDEFHRLREKSASFTAWGNSDGLHLLSKVLSRRIYSYRHHTFLPGWDLFDLEPEKSKDLDPVFLMNYGNMHFVPLIPRYPVKENPSARARMTFSGGHVKFSPKQFETAFESAVINLEDTQTDNSREEPFQIRNVITDNNTMENLSSKESELHWIIAPENENTCEWDPNIDETLGLKGISAKQLDFNDKVMLNILKSEIEQASRGPWKENMSVFSKRSSHNSFWRKKVAEMFPKHSSTHVTKKVNAMRTFFNQDVNFELVREALRALGVPNEICEEYNKSTRNSHITCHRRTDPSSTSRKAVLPRYFTKSSKDVSDISNNQVNDSETGAVSSTQQTPENGIDDSGESDAKTTFTSFIMDLAKRMNTPEEVFQYNPPTTFEFSIPQHEVKDMFDFETGTFTGNYPVVIDKHLNRVQKCCCFKSHHVPYVCKNRKPFANLRGNCGCGIEFKVRIADKPTRGQDVLCFVKSKGRFVLIQELPVGRQLTGIARDEAAKQMKHSKPGRVHLERLRGTDMYRALHNNYPQLSAAVLKLISCQSKKSDTTTTNVFDDIASFNQDLMEKFPKSHVSGFVHKFDRLPDHVSLLMYTQETLDLVHFFQRREEVVLHLDATGTVVTQKGLTSKKCLLCLFLAKTKDFTFPLAEALSQRGTTIEVSEMCRRLKYDSKRMYQHSKRFVGIAVCDFSFALIHGLLEGLNSTCLEDYLNYTFRLLQTGNGFHPERSVVFICTAHLIHAFSRLLHLHVVKEFHFIGVASLAKLQESHDLDTFVAASRCICKLFESKFLEEEEIQALRTNILSHSFQINEDDIASTLGEFIDELETVYHSNLRAKSLFYHLFQRERGKTHAETSKSNHPNTFYCPSIVQLLEDHYVPYTPLFATMLLKKTGRYGDCRITNACVEGQFSFIKNVFHTDGKTALNVFVREDFKYHSGKVAQVLETAMLSNRQIKGRRRKQDCKPRSQPPASSTKKPSGKTSFRTDAHKAKETWCRTPKKRHEPVYLATDKKLSSQRYGTRDIKNSGSISTAKAGFCRATPHGLPNLGQTCYFNSLMQALLSIPVLQKDIAQNSLHFMYSLLYQRKEPPSRRDIVAIIDSVRLECGISMPLTEEQDCHEILMHLLMAKSLGLQDLFYHMKEDIVMCKCGASRNNFVDAFYESAGPVGSFGTVIEGNSEVVAGTCEICDSTEKTLQDRLITAPQILLLIEKLFSATGAGKIDKHLRRKQIPGMVTVKCDSGFTEYNLVSVIAHLGESIHTGHYVAYSRKNGEWTRYNDEDVTSLNTDPTFESEDVYLTFYQKSM